MTKLTKYTLLFLLLLLSFFIRAQVADAKAIEWTWNVLNAPGTVYYDYTQALPKRILKATNGRLKINIVTGMVAPLDVMDAVKAGRFQGATVIYIYYGGSVPLWLPFGLPGLLKKEEDFLKPQREIVEPIIKKQSMEKWNCMPTAFGMWAGQGWYSNKPIKKISDFEGLKIRTHSLALTRFVKALGGSAVSLPATELYTSLQRGVVDATTQSHTPVKGYRLYEVLKYIDMWPTILGCWAFFVNTDALKALPNDVRDAIMLEFGKMSIEMPMAEFKQARETLDFLKGKGLQIIYPDAGEYDKALKIAREQIWPQWLKDAGAGGKEELNKIIKILGYHQPIK
jgi:TRAP-type C4-dicarboxylate transport system substrate-binding protein